jgi:Family of unknown function (DUF6152)
VPRIDAARNWNAGAGDAAQMLRSETSRLLNQWGEMMKRLSAVLFATCGIAAASTVALAHHSFAMFDQDHKVERTGVVKEYRFVAPHVFIMLEIQEDNGGSNLWALEGEAPTKLVRDGWTAKSLNPGDEIKLIVAPLRSGAAGGAWVTKDITFRDGKPIAVSP